MPSYIGFRPQFNPVSLQEYLAVPTMIQQEFDTYEDKYNENLDKLAVLEGMTDESTRYLTDRYKDKLSNAADVIAGKSGSLSDLRSQINNARQYYRETAPRLTNAYNKRQAALKAQQDILLKDPSAVTTKVGNMQSFMDNPDQVFHSLSGDKIYADMINAGKLSAADLSKVENANLPGYLAKITGYTPQQQQEYAMLVQQALSGNKDADKALRNNPIYTQPYQVLSKYIDDNKFGVFDDSERAYVLNRALSGQLMGMTGHTDYMADKQWEHNSRMSAARAASSGSNGLERYQMRNHVIQPKDRVASFGKDKEFTKSTGNVFEYKNGVLKTKTGRDFYKSIGFTSPVATSDYDYTRDFEKLAFNSDGTLRTKDELNKAIKAHNKQKGYNDLNYVGKNYEEFYQQIIDLGYDSTSVFSNTEDTIVTKGIPFRPIQSIETRKIGRTQQLLNSLNTLADNTNSNNPSNVGFRDIAINTTEESLKNAIKSASNDFTIFTGLTRANGQLGYSSKGKKKIDKSKIIKEIENNGGTLEYSPAAKGYIVTIQNKDKDLYFIDEDNWDETVHNYTDIDWEGYEQGIAAAEALLNEAEASYIQNPSSEIARQRYILALQSYNRKAKQYDDEWSELEKGFGASEAFSGMTNWNPNTESFHKEQ